MITSTTDLEKFGTVLRPSAINPFFFEDKDAAWIVLEGKLDLFVSPKFNDGELGARHHFLRIEPGAAVFGMEVHYADVTLLASASPGTKLLSITLNTLRSMIMLKHDLASSLVEEWIKAVGARLGTKAPPASFIDACSIGSIEIAEESKAIVAAEGVVWITHRRGESYPVADHQSPKLKGPGYFPVSRYIWVHACPESELHVVPTVGLPEVDRSWQGLHDFHIFVQYLLNVERQKNSNEDATRIVNKSISDATFVENALLGLTSPIRRLQISSEDRKSCSNHLFLALQMVADSMNIRLTPPVEMLRGQPLADPISSIAKASSIRVRKVALKGSWWKQYSGPLACFTEKDHRPLALLAQSSRMELFDPSTKIFVPLNETLASELNPIAYTLYRPFPVKVLNAIDLLKFGLTGCKKEVLLIVGTGLAAGALAIINPYATGIIFNRLIPGAERSQLIQISMFLLVIAFTSWLFMLARGFAVLRLQGKLDATVQAAVWDRLLSLPVSFFRDYSSGDLAQRSMGISYIREIMTGSTLDAILSGIFSVFSFMLLFYYSLRLAIVATMLVIVACIVSLAIGVIQLNHRRQLLHLTGALSSKLLQFISGIAKFRVSGTEGRAFAAWAREFAKQKRISVKARSISNGLTVFNSVFPVISLAVIFYANARFLETGGSRQLSTGDLLAFLAAFTQFLVAALTLSATLLSIMGVVPIYERAKPILHTIPEVTDAKSNPGVLFGNIEVSHVSFAYRPDTPLVLRDISFRIVSGQSVAFVGSSGCGKSTLLRLLLGFEHAASGAIYYDGQDLAGLDVQAVRHQIGVVLQTSRPISGSIFENIVGSAPLSIEDAWDACRLAGIDEDIRKMPMGLHTNISDGGGGISGGQRQRLMIARAIVAKPRILLFDEATSALDNRTQAIVSRSLGALQATRVIIAHRLSTVMNVDNIFVLDRGCIVESGSYVELMDHRGMFYDLAKRQLV